MEMTLDINFGGPEMALEKLTITVRTLVQEDVPWLESILRCHVRDRHSGEVLELEIQQIKGYMQGLADNAGRMRYYLVACNPIGQVIGCMAISNPDQEMIDHFGVGDKCVVELLNAFVSAEHFRGKGVGRALFDAACDYGRACGAHYLLVNSGLRYPDSWGFYDRVCDSDHGFIQDKYGKGRPAKAWKKKLL
jgi:GNAT superfamily N-acetyltransferase